MNWCTYITSIIKVETKSEQSLKHRYAVRNKIACDDPEQQTEQTFVNGANN